MECPISIIDFFIFVRCFFVMHKNQVVKYKELLWSNCKSSCTFRGCYSENMCRY